MPDSQYLTKNEFVGWTITVAGLLLAAVGGMLGLHVQQPHAGAVSEKEIERLLEIGNRLDDSQNVLLKSLDEAVAGNVESIKQLAAKSGKVDSNAAAIEALQRDIRELKRQ